MMSTTEYDDRMVRKMAARYVRTHAFTDADDADDVAQLLRIAWWQAELSGTDGPLALFFAIRKIRSRHLKRAPHAPVLTSTGTPGVGAASNDNPENAACIRKIRDVVSAAHWSLLRNTAAGMSAQEIAEQNGWTKTTAWRCVRDAKQAARAAL